MPCFSPSHTPNPSPRITQWKQGWSSQKRENTQPHKERRPGVLHGDEKEPRSETGDCINLKAAGTWERERQGMAALHPLTCNERRVKGHPVEGVEETLPSDFGRLVFQRVKIYTVKDGAPVQNRSKGNLFKPI